MCCLICVQPPRVAVRTGVRSDMLRTPAVPPLSPRSSSSMARAHGGWQGQPHREPLLHPQRDGSLV